MIINIEVRNVYGRELYYCLNETVCALVGKKTLDVRDRKLLMSMGHELVVTREPLRMEY